jgi:hypothetical protein
LKISREAEKRVAPPKNVEIPDMPAYEDRVFTNEVVDLDGNSFKDCTFKACKLVFNGVADPVLVGNRFDPACTYVFDGPALRTLQFLAALYIDGGAHLVEGTFDSIRKGPQE